MLRIFSILIKLTPHWRWLGVVSSIPVVVGFVVIMQPTAPPAGTYRYMLTNVEHHLTATEGILTVRAWYLPNQGIVIYSVGTAALAEQFRDATWVQTQLHPLTTVFAGFPHQQSLMWIYETPDDPIQQVTVEVPLASLDNPVYYVYSQQRLTASSGQSADPSSPPSVPTITALPSPPAGTPLIHATAVSDTRVVQPTDGMTLTLQPAINPSAPAWSLESSQWRSLAGDWTYAPNYARQDNQDGYDYMSFLQVPSMRDYRVQVRLRILDGTMGGGILYHLPSTSQRNGGQLVDLLHDDNFIRFGHYDETGTYQYEGGVQPVTPINDREWHLLALEQRGNQSTVLVDDAVIGTLQTQRTEGTVGLVTSQATVEFADFQLIPLGTNDTTSIAPTPTSADFIVPRGDSIPKPSTTQRITFETDEPLAWHALNGDWQVLDGQYHQFAASHLDFGSMSPFYGTDYTATVQLRAVTGALNGGLYLHVPYPDRKLNASLVALSNDAQQLEWGYFDANGNFHSSGMADLTLDRQKEWHELQVRVIADQVAVRVDGQLVAPSIPLSATMGYVGLLSSGGHLAYDTLEFEVAP